MLFTDLPPDVLLYIFSYLSNEALKRVQRTCATLYFLEESKKVQATRKIVPWIRKNLPVEEEWQRLNEVLMKLFRTLDSDFSLLKILVVCGFRTDPEEEEVLILALYMLGRTLPLKELEYVNKSGTWYKIRTQVHQETNTICEQFVAISVESMKSEMLSHKRWIECVHITTTFSKEMIYFCP